MKKLLIVFTSMVFILILLTATCYASEKKAVSGKALEKTLSRLENSLYSDETLLNSFFTVSNPFGCVNSGECPDKDVNMIGSKVNTVPIRFVNPQYPQANVIGALDCSQKLFESNYMMFYHEGDAGEYEYAESRHEAYMAGYLDLASGKTKMTDLIVNGKIKKAEPLLGVIKRADNCALFYEQKLVGKNTLYIYDDPISLDMSLHDSFQQTDFRQALIDSALNLDLTKVICFFGETIFQSPSLLFYDGSNEFFMCLKDEEYKIQHFAEYRFEYPNEPVEKLYLKNTLYTVPEIMQKTRDYSAMNHELGIIAHGGGEAIDILSLQMYPS